MKYMGSKARIAKHILPIILKDRTPDQWYVEPFVGGANSIDKVSGLRLGGEFNPYITALLEALANGWKPEYISKELYAAIKQDKTNFDPFIVGFAGICCSYSGKWFGGYAGKVKTKEGIRDYQAEAIKNILAQAENLCGITFICSHYYYLEIPENSIIYCDPPYAYTTKYNASFDHEAFWEWCREMVEKGHQVFVSEYEAPDDFECVWEKEVKSSLSANGVIGGNKTSIEKLFTLRTSI